SWLKGWAAVVHRPTESILRTPVRHQFVHCKLCSRDDPTELNRCRWLPSPIPQRASGILKPVRCFRAACPRRLFFFWVAGSIIDRIICIKDSRVFLAVKVPTNFNRPMPRLFYKARPPFGPPPKDCGWWPPVVSPEGGTPAPTLSRRFGASGSQRVPLSTVMNANGGGEGVINGRLKNL